MPVTGKFSKLFYDRLGEQVANELVDWLNQVDAAYRADLRELNELNFARFDAKLEQRIAELRAETREGFASLREHLAGQLAGLETKLERRLGEQSRWFIAAWAVLLAGVIGLWLKA
ncbi:MAG TPA: hypothetical protein VGQ69_08990 [Gemmatimonadales bacterium]|jgi:hypothetical protein|nr:hypothetical protein [Gemmatimonadales bacterium]